MPWPGGLESGSAAKGRQCQELEKVGKSVALVVVAPEGGVAQLRSDAKLGESDVQLAPVVGDERSAWYRIGLKAESKKKKIWGSHTHGGAADARPSGVCCVRAGERLRYLRGTLAARRYVVTIF